MYRTPVNVGHMPRMLRNRVPAGTEYLGEDEHYYYVMVPGENHELAGFGNMFKRMVKITPKSFTPGNIYKGFINTTLTTASGGLYQLLPKGLKKTVYDVGKIAVPIIAGGVLAVVAGPAVMAVLGPKLAMAGSLLGKVAGTMGGNLMNILGKMSGPAQAKIVESLTPQQIAQMETSQGIPPALEPLFQQAAAQSYPSLTSSGGYSGAASLYGPSQPAEPTQAGMGFDLNMNTMLLIGVPLAFYFLTAKGGKGR